MTQIPRAILGCFALLFLAWLLGGARRRFPFKVVAGGMVLQFVFAIIVLKTSVGATVFDAVGHLFAIVIGTANTGAEFVFGKLVDDHGTWGFVFAVKALPTIIVFSSLSTIGYHLGILQRVVAVMAVVMSRLMGTSGAESLSAAANVFMGQTEAPLLVRPYIPRMTMSELNAVMTVGFATIAGSLMAVYAQMLGEGAAAKLGMNATDSVARMAKHLLTASVISAPAGLLMAKIIVPETESPETAGSVRSPVERTTRNIIDAAATGAADGLKLALNVAAMLIAFIAIITLLDLGLGWIGGIEPMASWLKWGNVERLSLGGILGTLFAPVAWLVGVERDECRSFGSLLGTAMAANEFVSYKSLSGMIASGAISIRTATIAIYALCGFANFSSIGIQLAGIGGMAPERSHDLARLGLRAMLGGALACWMTAWVAALLL